MDVNNVYGLLIKNDSILYKVKAIMPGDIAAKSTQKKKLLLKTVLK